jgi:hypothetical protein
VPLDEGSPRFEGSDVMKGRLRRHRAKMRDWTEEVMYWLVWSVFEQRPRQRPQALAIGALLGAVTTRWGDPVNVFSGLVVGFSVVAVAYLLVRIPVFGRVAEEEDLRALSFAGAFFYYVAGVVCGDLSILAITDRSSLRTSLAVLIMITILVNSIVLNLAIHLWNRLLASQKDIGKMLVRTPVLVALGGIGNWVGDASIAKLAVTGTTVLLIPSTLELLLTLAKTPLETQPDRPADGE